MRLLELTLEKVTGDAFIFINPIAIRIFKIMMKYNELQEGKVTSIFLWINILHIF